MRRRVPYPSLVRRRPGRLSLLQRSSSPSSPSSSSSSSVATEPLSRAAELDRDDMRELTQLEARHGRPPAKASFAVIADARRDRARFTWPRRSSISDPPPPPPSPSLPTVLPAAPPPSLPTALLPSARALDHYLAIASPPEARASHDYDGDAAQDAITSRFAKWCKAAAVAAAPNLVSMRSMMSFAVPRPLAGLVHRTTRRGSL